MGEKNKISKGLRRARRIARASATKTLEPYAVLDTGTNNQGNHSQRYDVVPVSIIGESDRVVCLCNPHENVNLKPKHKE